MDIEKTINNFKEDEDLGRNRYTSFDFCYNYFKMCSGKKLVDQLQMSTTILWSYLASWGMLRGSSFLLKNENWTYLKPLINYISTLDESVWQIDVDSYNSKNIQSILDIYNNVESLLSKSGHATLTLNTKVMLGVFGFIPAFDSYFIISLKDYFKGERIGFSQLSEKNLNFVKRFYDENREIIDRLSLKFFTKDFDTEKATHINYTKAKIIDMYGFNAGLTRNK